MNPKERVLAAMNGEAIFPVPTDVFENGVHPELRRRLAQHFGFAESDNESLMQSFGASIRWCRPLYIGPALEESDSHVPVYPATRMVKDIWGTWGEAAATYYDGLPRPLQNVESVADINAYPWPNPDWFDYSQVGWIMDEPEAYVPVAQWAEKFADYAKLGGGWSPIFSKAMDMYGIEQGLMCIAERPDLMEATIRHIGEFLEEYYRRFARACRGHLEILAWGDDFSSQRGLMLRPALWRQWFLPIWKRLFAIAHENDMKAAFHSCGAVRAIIPDLIGAGLDILENVQTNCTGMAPQELKREYGRELTFYGGMDTQAIMPRGSCEEVRSEVRRLIDIFGENGRYIFTTSHYLMDDVSLENAVALYDEANSYTGAGTHSFAE